MSALTKMPADVCSEECLDSIHASPFSLAHILLFAGGAANTINQVCTFAGYVLPSVITLSIPVLTMRPPLSSIAQYLQFFVKHLFLVSHFKDSFFWELVLSAELGSLAQPRLSFRFLGRWCPWMSLKSLNFMIVLDLLQTPQFFVTIFFSPSKSG